MQPLSILAVPAFTDNYLWLIHDGKFAVAVDPGDAAPIQTALKEHNLTLSAILLTHHHADHVGGVPALLEQYPVPVFGPAHDNIKTVSHPLEDGEQLYLDNFNLSLDVMEVPGHTLGHIAYYSKQLDSVFCGDTLFAGGCGRMFEGTPEQMLASLEALSALPDATKVYCAHEYTLSNLKFARDADPENTLLIERSQTEQAKRDAGLPTVPSSLLLERATNPFLRCRQPSIVQRLRALGKIDAEANPTQVFAALREWKNNYS